jgi:hypothetical protein
LLPFFGPKLKESGEFHLVEISSQVNTLPKAKSQLGRACFSRNFSPKMVFFFAEQIAAKMAFFPRSEKWRKMNSSRCEMRRKMVQFWAVSWVEHVFSDFFREKGHFLSRSKIKRQMALCGWRKMAKNGAFQKKFERKKLAKMALLKRRTGFPQRATPAASRTRTCTNAEVRIASGECPSRF